MLQDGRWRHTRSQFRLEFLVAGLYSQHAFVSRITLGCVSDVSVKNMIVDIPPCATRQLQYWKPAWNSQLLRSPRKPNAILQLEPSILLQLGRLQESECSSISPLDWNTYWQGPALAQYQKTPLRHLFCPERWDLRSYPAIGADPAKPARNRNPTSMLILLLTAQAVVKMTKRILVTRYMGSRPYISDNGARIKGLTRSRGRILRRQRRQLLVFWMEIFHNLWHTRSKNS